MYVDEVYVYVDIRTYSANSLLPLTSMGEVQVKCPIKFKSYVNFILYLYCICKS